MAGKINLSGGSTIGSMKDNSFFDGQTMVEILNHHHNVLEGRHIFIEKEEKGKPEIEMLECGDIVMRGVTVIDSEVMKRVEQFVIDNQN